jgi:Family of unknown function (DUF6191)
MDDVGLQMDQVQPGRPTDTGVMAGWFRRPRDGDGVTSGFLGDLIEVFQPSRRHVEAERERRQSHAQLPESGAPPLLVDLDAGVAYLPAPPAGGEQQREHASGTEPEQQREHASGTEPEQQREHASGTEPEQGADAQTGERPTSSAADPDVVEPGP